MINYDKILDGLRLKLSRQLTTVEQTREHIAALETQRQAENRAKPK